MRELEYACDAPWCGLGVDLLTVLSCAGPAVSTADMSSSSGSTGGSWLRLIQVQHLDMLVTAVDAASQP